jgi:hypothetical protein
MRPRPRPKAVFSKPGIDSQHEWWAVIVVVELRLEGLRQVRSQLSRSRNKSGPGTSRRSASEVPVQGDEIPAVNEAVGASGEAGFVSGMANAVVRTVS